MSGGKVVVGESQRMDQSRWILSLPMRCHAVEAAAEAVYGPGLLRQCPEFGFEWLCWKHRRGTSVPVETAK